MSSFLKKLWVLVCRERFNRELEEEMAFHREQKKRDLESDGMTPESARHAAMRNFGNAIRLKEQSYEVVSFPFESILQDVRFAIRQLVKNLGFACTATFILALGIAASVAIFGFVDAALIKPLPYQSPSRLVALFESTPLGPQFHLSYLDYLDWKKMNQVFSSLEAYENHSFTMATVSGTQQADGAQVSDGFFRTLGVAPILGRDFRSGEDQSSASRVVMLSYSVWQKRFGGRQDILGQTVTLDGARNTIVGVLPSRFHFAPAGPAEFWTALHTGCMEDRGCHGLSGIARLKDGVALQAAAADLTAVARQLEKQYPGNRDRGATVIALNDLIVGSLRSTLVLLLSGAVLLLLIACFNVASLLMVRSESRRREIAVRGALGASATRLVRQFATEGLVLVAVGSAFGLLVAYGMMQFFLRLIPVTMMAGMPYLQEIGLNVHAVLFVCTISLLAAVLFSLIPIFRLSFGELREGLMEGGRNAAGTVWLRFGTNFVVIELAIAMVLLVGAGLLGKSFYRLLHVDTGMQPDHLAVLRIIATDTNYSKDEQIVALAQRVLTQVTSLPGVKSAGISSVLPVGNGNGTATFRILGRPYHDEQNEANVRQVSVNYFTTLQARLLQGRYFTEAEDTSKPHVVIINKAMARKYFPSEDPLGKRISSDGSLQSAKEIVGVVDDVKEGPLDMEVRPAMYTFFNQEPWPGFFAVVRTSQDPQFLLPALSSTVHQIDPNVAAYGETTMEDRMHDSPSAYFHRSSAWLVGGFAVVALLLGSVGLYGVIAHSVGQRTREIGVRMALGAQRSSVYHLILKEAGGLIAIGLCFGLVCSLVAANFMRKLLFGIHAWDVSILLLVTAVLAVSALLASYVPARRAASVNPMEALRAE